jgi:proliferating cell nuclear antigen
VDVKGDSGEVKAEFESGSSEVLELKSEQMVKATFPLQYLEDIVKGTSSSSIITLYLETDRPLKLEYEMEGAKFVYYLAPRIETE